MKRGIVSRHVGDGQVVTGNRRRGLTTPRKLLQCFLLVIGLGLLVAVLAGCDGLLPCCW